MIDYIDALSTELLLTSVGLVLGYLALRKLSPRRLPLPPGPPSYPIVGQLFSMPRSSEGHAFMELSARLNSDIISYSFLGNTIIVLNSNEVAHDLLEKRSIIHSGRYCAPMLASPNLINMKNFLPFMNTNELWKKQRRAINSRLSSHAVTMLRAAQDSEARRLLARLLAAHEEPMTSEHLNAEFYRTTSALFLQSVYGYELKSSEDQFLNDIISLNSVLNQASLPTGFLVNVFPWMEHIPDWFPGTGWKQTAYQWRALKDRAIDNVYNWSKQRIIDGLDDSSVVSHIYRDARQTGFNEADADDFCKNYIDSILSTRTKGAQKQQSTLAMLWFVVAMAMYPDIQEKAQQEIDQIVGTDRLPNAEDRPSLRYVERLLTEIKLMLLPSRGVPHVCTEENEYRGYRIPKGAVMIGHIRATVREEHVYKDAEEFNPDRFLDPTVPPPQAFGICPGQHFFREMFYIEVVLILATMKVERCKDENGKDIVPTAETTENNVISRPVPFKVKIVPRSEHHAELIRTAV
ncbi:unnamed protein product [Rhizoctonia solani]|uniref:O-methylsterigmatocystin oxidoreductase n=1 Tax=Rhizoctonia solani TaxID=456999 RepID=A0A8H3H113_9AGAM|nr:unnamed protein product [Rhizoctonia solani]